MDVFHFQEENCKTMVDTDKSSVQPTAQNITQALKELVEASKPGDQLFMHFSGHGLQLPAPPGSQEQDRKDEAIVACDLNLIVDDDLREAVKPLAKGVVLTVVMDCCHSGGLLDHKEVQLPIEGDFDINLASFMSLLGMKPSSKEIDTERLGSNKLKNRSYPTDSYMRALGAKAGVKADEMNFVGLLSSVYGESVSSRFKELIGKGEGLVGTGEDLVAEVNQVSQEVKRQGCLVVLLGFLGLGAKDTKKSAPPVKQKHRKKDLVSKDVGVLITGCQSNEKSADANLSGNKKTAGGAMTRALVNVVRSHYEENPDKPITNSNVVLGMRQTLKKAGFKQHPSLEGSALNAEKGFVTGKKE